MLSLSTPNNAYDQSHLIRLEKQAGKCAQTYLNIIMDMQTFANLINKIRLASFLLNQCYKLYN